MTPPGAPLRFGRFELQPYEHRLLRDGAPVALGGRAFKVLLALAERPGRLVSKAALIELVWPGRVVQENNLAAQVSMLRKVLGDEVIATIPGRGYRFVAPIAADSGGSGDAQAPTIAPAPVGASPAPAQGAAPRTNLPAVLPPLLGREADLVALGALVDRHRLVNIVGAGGIGKSLLAQHLLAARHDAYAMGVCWVELATVADASALPGTVAAALGVEVGTGEPLAALQRAAAPLALLLALDNAEHHLAEVAALCRALHEAGPELRLLLTSQAPLRLAAEQVYRLGPLAVPPSGSLPAEEAARFGAVALFGERARAADAHFTLTDGNAADVIEICRVLDGLPLAIELAAARLPLLGARQLLASMPERLRLLTRGPDRDAPARQRTLRDALAWSHDLLPAPEQRVFRRLGLVAGSASLALLQQALAGGGPPGLDEGQRGGQREGKSEGAGEGDTAEAHAWQVLDRLDALVDRSFVAVQTGSGDRAPRYRLPESARLFALERLHEAGEVATFRARFARALAALADAAYTSYFSGDVGVDDWAARLAPDLHNAREAVAWARESGDAMTLLTLGATLLRALPPSLHEERLALADLCEATLAPAVNPALAPTRVPTLPEALQQRVWLELACAWADTQKQRCRDAAAQALRLARRLDKPGGDRFPLYLALSRMASAAAQAGDLDAARAPLEELRGIEDARWPAQRLLWGAEAAQVHARLRGDAAETLRLSRQLVALDRERGSDASIALGNLIDHELAAGDARAATRTGAALVAALRGTRHEYSLTFAQINLCAAWLALDDVGQARDAAAAAWPLARRFDLQQCAATYLALLAALAQRPRAAARLLGFALAQYAARDEAIEANEAQAQQRARALAVAVIGEAATSAGRALGASLRDGQIAALAFAEQDVAEEGG